MKFKMPEVLVRIFNSKRFWLAMVPILANAIAAATGQDLTNTFLTIVDVAFFGSATLQGAHDIVHGSISDGTAQAKTENKETVVISQEHSEPTPEAKPTLVRSS